MGVAFLLQVVDTIKEWKDILWAEAPPQIPFMTERIQFFSDACKKLPKQLKTSDAFAELKKEIDDFTEVLDCSLVQMCASICYSQDTTVICNWGTTNAVSGSSTLKRAEQAFYRGAPLETSGGNNWKVSWHRQRNDTSSGPCRRRLTSIQGA